MPVHNFDKQFHALRYLLIGRRYFEALRMLELASQTHRGNRKDGITPELDHPITVALTIATLESGLMYPEATLAAGLGHDLPEDYPATLYRIRGEFSLQTSRAIELVTKQYRGIKRSPEEVFASMAEDPVASVVKGIDRVHNSGTMVGVFTRPKQVEYMDETRTFVLPMLKQARRNFPEQHGVYINIKLMLVSQLQMLEAIHAASRR